jgi:hypothetical protein
MAKGEQIGRVIKTEEGRLEFEISLREFELWLDKKSNLQFPVALSNRIKVRKRVIVCVCNGGRITGRFDIYSPTKRELPKLYDLLGRKKLEEYPSGDPTSVVAKRKQIGKVIKAESGELEFELSLREFGRWLDKTSNLLFPTELSDGIKLRDGVIVCSCAGGQIANKQMSYSPAKKEALRLYRDPETNKFFGL